MGTARTSSSRQQITTAPSPADHTRIPYTSASKRKRNADEKASVASTSAKRNRRNGGDHPAIPTDPKDVIDLTSDSPVASPQKRTSSAKMKQSPGEGIPERRARVFRRKPPQTFLQRLNRATTQRMFVLGHIVTGADDIPEMSFDIAGTTGNIYKTVIGKEPTCTCPDARKGNQCKHICYVLVNVLKAPQHLQYQLAFLSMELREIYEGSFLSREQTKVDDDNGGNRKAVEGDCPICFMEFEPDREEIVWCRAACGNNIHKTCFQQWAVLQKSQGVRCVFCRSPWEADTSDVNLEQLRAQGQTTAEGYINVASQLGLSGQRDYSTYHPFWVSQQLYPYGSRRRRR
ncbi:RING finger domain protein [Aspergillus pseudonomiae]|uniref:RING finger domain protein n=1 Tax=Aspergillus pseudonomiae TaxID=1506151 RepID=A0A5N7D504_9EURO|nr:RING finger domain protein [Aspergillus pseudonomiae]KAB8257421.1 RING finger domain protein [Aspergillus pseudonomiae]KAE8400888.1 RING finger domain protein [Aspergillus pseudonomiae]